MEELCLYQNVQCVIVKESKFIKEQQASRLLSRLGIKIVGPPLFQRHSQVSTRYKMNEIVNNFLLAEDKFMPDMQKNKETIKSKNKERILKFKEKRDSQYIDQNKIDKACFQHGMTYGDFKDLTRRTASDKILHNKAFNIATNAKYVLYQKSKIRCISTSTCFNGL